MEGTKKALWLFRSRESGMIKQWLLIFAHAPFLRRPFSRLIFSLIYVKGVGLPPFQIPSTNLCTQLLFDSKPALFLGRAFFEECSEETTSSILNSISCLHSLLCLLAGRLFVEQETSASFWRPSTKHMWQAEIGKKRTHSQTNPFRLAVFSHAFLWLSSLLCFRCVLFFRPSYPALSGLFVGVRRVADAPIPLDSFDGRFLAALVLSTQQKHA